MPPAGSSAHRPRGRWPLELEHVDGGLAGVEASAGVGDHLDELGDRRHVEVKQIAATVQGTSELVPGFGCYEDAQRIGYASVPMPRTTAAERDARRLLALELRMAGKRR